MADTTVGWRFTNPRMPSGWTISLGQTAERVAECYGITRRQAGRVRRRESASGPGGPGRGGLCR
jgi:acetyl-CoA acetyltransferase